MHFNLKQTHNYWKNDHFENHPVTYFKGEEKSILLCRAVEELFPNRNTSILEIGCSVGRNLNFLLRRSKYTNLYGIEINPVAVKLMIDSHRSLFNVAKIYISSVEDIIKEFPDNLFDLVFTIAVFEHIHPESDWIFKEVGRITKNIITIEDEVHDTQRVFKRNYKKVFEDLGMKQTAEINLPIEGEFEGFKGRVFAK